MTTTRSRFRAVNEDKSSPEPSTRSLKRTIDTTEQNDDPISPEEEPKAPADDQPGLDWDWVKALDQDPTKHDYFPDPFTPPAHDKFTGDDDDQPKLTTADVDLTDYTAWVLARIKKMLISRAVIFMVQDPKVQMDSRPEYPHLQSRTQISRVETGEISIAAAYAAMVGIILPPERSCTSCKANNSPFRNCIVLPGYLNGSCAGCHYNSGGSRCSHRDGGRKRARVAGMLRAGLPSTLFQPVPDENIQDDEERPAPLNPVLYQAVVRMKAEILDILEKLESLERLGTYTV
ncbi:hypothetical protein F4805DRAFT_473134 [Annulohypoxylon moriforme]|nr:hypothetical protein F4805DRAFT_473134 [Annulohypoxylon moriforme]